MVQEQFAEKIRKIVKEDGSVIGLAVGGSWLTHEMDEFSDLDLILVTKEKVAGDRTRMRHYAGRFGQLLTAFTGEHVGEPRLLICLYDSPLLHVDIKFLTIDELDARIETPAILHDTDGQLQLKMGQSEPRFPYPDYQWIEDRFWVWIHYTLLKIGRGEYFETLDSLAYLRKMIFGPLLHIRNGNLPKAVRKVETMISPGDLGQLRSLLAEDNKGSLLKAVNNAATLYSDLRKELFGKEIILHEATRERVMKLLQEMV
jgi:Nucleotidyltransferase domain